MNLSRTVVEERTQKEIAVQHALAQARAEMQEKIDSVQVVTGDEPKVTYNVNWTNAAGQSHIVEAIPVMDTGDGEESDKELKAEWILMFQCSLFFVFFLFLQSFLLHKSTNCLGGETSCWLLSLNYSVSELVPD